MDVRTWQQWLVDNEQVLWQYGLNVFSAVVILIVGLMMAKWVTKYSRKVMQKRDLDPTTMGFITLVLRYGIILFTIVIALGNLGVKTAPLITMLGAAGIAVGLALQSSLSNFAAGLIMVIFRPVSVGDYVEVSGKAGTVLAISIISTTLREANGYIHTIPNNAMVNSAVSNLTGSKMRRTDIVIGVGYDANIKTVKTILTEIVDKQTTILRDQDVKVELDDLGASSINFLIRYTTSTDDILGTRWAILEEAKIKLDEAGVDIPYQTINVHMVDNKPN